MTDTTTLAADFAAALNSDIAARLRLTTAIEYHLHVATTQQGWSVTQLATEASRDLDSATNIGAVVTERLRVAATVGPPKAKTAPISKGVPFCTDECRENQGWVYDFTVEPPAQSRCECRYRT